MNCPNCGHKVSNSKQGTKEEKKLWAFKLAELMKWDEAKATNLCLGSSLKQSELKEIVERLE